jgi:hypothetical protein
MNTGTTEHVPAVQSLVSVCELSLLANPLSHNARYGRNVRKQLYNQNHHFVKCCSWL